jgi:hypothetical protein
MSHKFWVALMPTGQPFTVANSPKNDFSSIDLLGEASDLITMLSLFRVVDSPPVVF